MKPLLTAAQMHAVDAAAVVTTPLEQLIARAGYAVATTAIAMLGGAYAKRVVVIAGKGHNGDDGRVAASVLRKRGASVVVYGASDAPDLIGPCDLVIDAAFGTGFHGVYRAPLVNAPSSVLAVDIPSGLDGDTGIASDGAVRADVTVTFGAYKPGLLFCDGPTHAGRVIVADIGLPLDKAPDQTTAIVEDADIRHLPRRRADGHKWDTAVYVVAGSPGMLGASELVTRAAIRSGAGMVRLGSPGVALSAPLVTEAVAVSLPDAHFADTVLGALSRCRSLVIGPGLGTDPATTVSVNQLIGAAPIPVVIDADALNALAGTSDWQSLVRGRGAPTVLTPHDGEYARLAGDVVGSDRIAAARSLSASCGAVVLLKGTPTVIAGPDGTTLIVTSGTSQLSTAGSGDVLSGVIGAFIARGCDVLHAAAYGAHVHGRAASRGVRDGLIASDLPNLVAAVLSGRGRGYRGHGGSHHHKHHNGRRA